MTPEKDWLKKAERADFDPNGRAQRRVWTRLQEKKAVFYWKKPLAWSACAAVLLAAGGFFGLRWSAQLHCPDSAPEASAAFAGAQCKNSTGRYLFSAELECDGATCSCTKTLTICDEHPVTRVTRKTCKASADGFSPQNPWELWENNSTNQIQDPASCRNQC